MKKTVLLIALCVIIISSIVTAQNEKKQDNEKMMRNNIGIPHKHPGMNMYPDNPLPPCPPAPPLPGLTKEQNEEIEKLHLEHMKVTLPMNNNIGEKEAQLHSERTSDKPDMGKINQLVEEIGTIRINIAKEKEALHQKIRKLLDGKQRIIFDTAPPKIHHNGSVKYFV